MRPLVVTIRQTVIEAQRTWVFERSPIVIGADPTADLRLPGDLVTKLRCTIAFTDDGVSISDRGSHPPLTVEGRAVGKLQVAIGETSQIRCGPLQLFFSRRRDDMFRTPDLNPSGIPEPIARQLTRAYEDKPTQPVPAAAAPPPSPEPAPPSERRPATPPRVPDPPVPEGFEPLPPGTAFGRYQTVALLGVGGMGAVYQGWDPAVGRNVAIKVLSRELASRADTLARFKREAASAGQISHLNVVDIYDVGVASGLPYIVMEYLVGEDVGLLLRRKTLAVSQAADILVDACAGVGAMHELGMVHRDLKPRNLFMAKTRMGKLVKVVDFGVVKLLSEMSAKLTGLGMAIGTPHYMAPEQIRASGVVDTRADQFALGVVLYQCLTGRRPHDGKENDEVVENILADRFPAPRALRPEIPVALEAAVLRAMAGAPTDRYESVYDLGTALLPFASTAAQGRWTLTGAPPQIDTTGS
jgi:hypothetical protein